MTHNYFIKKINEKFGNKFNLSKVVFNNKDEEICIICPEHGEINVLPFTFLNDGCPLCKNEKKRLEKQEKFIKKANEKHAGKYDYSKVYFTKTLIPVKIICPKHGEFLQKPSHHLIGCECPKCGKLRGDQKQKLTTEKWIEKAKKIHGNKYDYSKVEYKDYETKVCIICPEHGEFWQKAGIHVSRKHGCPKCGVEENLKLQKEIGSKNFNETIEKLKHQYIINPSSYINNNEKISVICKKHGEFLITPYKLKTLKTPCPKCREELKKPKKEKIVINYFEIFKNELNKKYPDRYSFDKCNYKNKDTSVILFDKQINEYITVIPNSILKSKNLLKLDCYKHSKLPTITFIEKAKKIHSDKYDYSKVEYTHNKKKVLIICPEHGEFWQTPNEHLKGCGCSLCAGNIKWDEKDYLNEVKKIHGNKYDYSKMVLKNQCDHITLICPEHGEFQIRASNHLKGNGCPKCVGSSGEKILLSYFESKNLYPHYNKFYKWLDNLQLDFYFPEYKLAIEVQGKQHFIDNNFFETPFEIQIERDTKKSELCKKNGIELLYYANYKMNFPYYVYTDIDELYQTICEKIKSLEK